MQRSLRSLPVPIWVALSVVAGATAQWGYTCLKATVTPPPVPIAHCYTAAAQSIQWVCPVADDNGVGATTRPFGLLAPEGPPPPPPYLIRQYRPHQPDRDDAMAQRAAALLAAGVL